MRRHLSSRKEAKYYFISIHLNHRATLSHELVMKQFRFLKRLMIIVASTVMAIGCANRGSADEPPLAEMSYVNMNQLPSGNGQVNNIRQQGLREIAIMLGARGALVWRSEHIDAALEKQSSCLDPVFDSKSFC